MQTLYKIEASKVRRKYVKNTEFRLENYALVRLKYGLSTGGTLSVRVGTYSVCISVMFCTYFVRTLGYGLQGQKER